MQRNSPAEARILFSHGKASSKLFYPTTSHAPPNAPAATAAPMVHIALGTLHRSSAAFVTGIVFEPTMLSHSVKLRIEPVNVGGGMGDEAGKVGVNVSVKTTVSPSASVVV